MSDHRDGAFDDWLDAAEEGDPYYLECSQGHGSLPPRRICPDCGETDLKSVSLPAVGEIATVTVTHVPTPSFEDDAPYALVVADFGPVRLTGQITRTEQTDLDSIATGQEVELSIRNSKTTGERVITFELW